VTGGRIMPGPSITMKKRLLVVLIIFTLIITGLTVRVGWIQIVQGEFWQTEAYNQHNLGRVINPKRGTIYDRNYKELAVSASVDTISVNPAHLKQHYDEDEIKTMAEELAAIFESTEEEKESIYAKMTRSSRYEIIKSKVEKDVGDKVREWIQKKQVTGINVDEDSKRYYPNRNLAAHIIGFTRVDNVGIYGIERIMENELKGVPGKILSEVDAGGSELPFSEEKYIKPQDGLNVVLTIDETIQYFAEKALDNAMQEHNVQNGGVAIVMDPRNGDILALVSKPDYDLNDPRAFPEGIEGLDPTNWTGYSTEDVKVLSETVWRNKAVEDTYEPGSTFKAITAAAGLEEGVVTPESPVNDFTVKIAGYNIDCWKPNAHGNETFREGVYNSCNPVFVRVAQSLGVERFFKYMKAFGFYEKTGVTLLGEANSQIWENPTEINMATASFGQRFQITPIQLITAYAAIANGGTLMKPRLIKELTDSEGNVVKKYEPEVVRQVISKQTSDTLRNILEGVVAEGTGGNAYVEGYRVAGKTGTSETLVKGQYIASFSAFAPADNPVICVLVILDNPNSYSYYGGQIAAPVAAKIIEDTLTYLGVERRYTEKDKELLLTPVYVHDVRGMTVENATKQLKNSGLKYIIEGDANNKSAIVMEQTPKPGATVLEESVVILYTYKPETEVMVAVPNLLGRTIDEAKQTLNSLGLNIKINGLGTVVKQSQAAGTMVPKGEVIEVDFIDFNTH